MNLWWLIVSACGLALLAASSYEARRPAISPTEARVFHAVNGLPNWLYWPLWLPMQFGNLVVGTVVGTRRRVGRRATGGSPPASSSRRSANSAPRSSSAARWPTTSPIRQRPGTSEVGAILRGADVPSSGASFPSGHVILVAAIATVVAPAIPVGWWWVPVVLTLLVMFGRVFVGAHNPLDVTAGLGAGLLVGGIVAVFVR